MTLKLELRPLEAIHIGDNCRITNGESRTVFVVEGSALVLRARHVLKKTDVVDSVTRLYFIIQTMGLSHYDQSDLLACMLDDPGFASVLDPEERSALVEFVKRRQYYSALLMLQKRMRSSL
jgi:flagellar biosynthesis regulator FlbT